MLISFIKSVCCAGLHCSAHNCIFSVHKSTCPAHPAAHLSSSWLSLPLLCLSNRLQVDDLDIFTIGPKFENNPVFPARTNTEFVEVLSRQHVRMVVWERGAGRTLACGTGACATVVAGVLEGKTDRKCQVDLPGGPLHIEWRESDNHIYMTGPAELAFSGSVMV